MRESGCNVRWRDRLAQAETITEAPPTVFIVDDDPAIRESLGSLLRSVGLEYKALSSVPEFLKWSAPTDLHAWCST